MSDTSKVIAVFGAGTGLGAAVARRFAREGFRVALVARRKDRLDALVDQLTAEGTEAAGFTADLSKPAVLTALGGPSREPAGPTAPTKATVRRILQRVDGDALDEAIGAWLAARDPDRPPPDHDLGRRARRSPAVDGKTVRGARRADGTQVHLLAAMTGTGLVAAQREVGAKTNEITVFRPMLVDLDLADTVVTFDALHSQTAHSRFLVEERNAHYIAVIKTTPPRPPRKQAPAGRKKPAGSGGSARSAKAAGSAESARSAPPPQRRSAWSSRQEEETEFLGRFIRASAWPEQQYKRLFKRLPVPGRVAMLLATAAALYWLFESGAWIPLLVLGVAAFVVTVIVHETRMERKYPTPRSLLTPRDDRPKPRRKPSDDDAWWDEMMARRQREEEPRIF